LGARTLEELQRTYPPEVEKALRARLAQEGFPDYDSFLRALERKPGEMNDFVGGITHELSSLLAKRQLFDHIAKRKPFVYDSSNAKTPEYMDRVIPAGLRRIGPSSCHRRDVLAKR
jgi:chemotaxis methyl-accepting protein methylase